MPKTERAGAETLTGILKGSRRLFAGNTAVLQKENDDYVGYDYERIVTDAERLGTYLRSIGEKGKNIAVCGPGGRLWVTAYLAVSAFVGTAVPLSESYDPDMLKSALGLCNVSLVIGSIPNEELSEGIGVISFSELDEIISSTEKERVDTPQPSDIAEIACVPDADGGGQRAVILTHENICFTINELSKCVELTKDDLLYSVLPLSHSYERICGLWFPLFSGATIAYGEGLKHLTSNLRRVRPTVMLCVPLIIDKLYSGIWENIEKKGIGEKVRKVIKLTNAAGPLRTAVRRELFAEIHDTLGGRLSIIYSGGSPADPEVIGGLHDFGIRVFEGYGMTETAAVMALNRHELHEYGSQGAPLPSGLIDIYDVQSDGIGEIRYRGRNVTPGYLGAPGLTGRTIRDGWIYTGDMGYFDQRGFIRVVGRKSNVIPTGKNRQIFPEELENELIKNPFVGEAVVIGITNEAGTDNDVIAVLVPDTDSIATIYGPNYTDEAMIRELSNAVRLVNASTAKYKHIEKFILRRAPFERGIEGRIDRGAIAAATKNSIKKKI